MAGYPAAVLDWHCEQYANVTARRTLSMDEKSRELRMEELENISGGWSESQLTADELAGWNDLKATYLQLFKASLDGSSSEEAADLAWEAMENYNKVLKMKYGE